MKNSLRKLNIIIIITYSIILLLVLYFQKGQNVFFNKPALLFYPIAFIAGIISIALEYFTGALLIFFKTKQFPRGFNIHAVYSGSKINIIDILIIILLVIAEELVFRQVLFSFFFTGIKLSLWLAVILCTLIYAGIHIYFGLKTIPQKIVSGLLYVCLFYFSGMSIIIPIITHCVQNLSLVVITMIRERKIQA
ncbi:CPBP family intramembrane glutamic endopeptidase [Spirochaetota bacterium]